MTRARFVFVLLFILTAFGLGATPGGATTQATSVLHIKVALAAADGSVTPIPKHALLISDNPTTSAPRRVVTAIDGTADVHLEPGSYTIESDRPTQFQGKAYEWTQTVTIAAGRDLVLELNAANASTNDAAATGVPSEADESALFLQFQDAVVGIWSETAHGSGFLIDANGLIATNQHIIGSATSVEVQLAPAVKVAARVVASNPAKNVAILRVDPKVVASIHPMRVKYGQTIAEGQKVFSIGAPAFQPKDMAPATVRRVGTHAIESDITLDRGSSGGPVFTSAGDVIGITTLGDDTAFGQGDSGIVGIDDARDLISEAGAKVEKLEQPSGTHRPVEPERRVPAAALEQAAQGRAGSLKPYQMQAGDFDVSFITPVMTFGAQSQADKTNQQARASRGQNGGREPDMLDPLSDYGNWAEYVGEFRQVLMIRVTPKLVSGAWSVVGRAAARTQGVDLPPGAKHVKAGFGRMRVLCGDAEVTPIHPFKIAHPTSDGRDSASPGDTVYEGLYIFDPGALGPQCATVTLQIFSEQEPAKGDTHAVDARIIQEIWQDFALYRAAG